MKKLSRKFKDAVQTHLTNRKSCVSFKCSDKGVSMWDSFKKNFKRNAELSMLQYTKILEEKFKRNAGLLILAVHEINKHSRSK